MKIGILTFHCAINYGAVLQAYCLQEYLKSLGNNVYIIDYRPNYLIKPYRCFNYNINNNQSLFQNTKKFIRSIFTAIIRKKRERKFKSFTDNRLQLIDLESAKKSHFDVLIYGSDQIWNPKITDGYDPIYFGAIEWLKSCKKVSYAASIGNINNIEKIEQLQQLLHNFDLISVREDSLKKYIETQFKLKSETTIDPVLLTGRNTLSKIADPHNLPTKPYLLVFQLEHDEQVVSLARDIAKEMGLLLVDSISFAESIADKRIRQTLSPEELVAYIEHADFVVSTSFHGTALSISLQKQFYAVEVYRDISDRIHQMLDSLEIGHRIISLNQQLPKDILDYSEINKRLDRIRNRSVEFLHNATTTPR